jgi:hypothetical protein
MSSEETVVQVRITGSPRTYAYAVPDGLSVAVGDWVELPAAAPGRRPADGRVEGFGRDGYAGPVKPLTGLAQDAGPVVQAMRSVTTHDGARAVYRRAKADGAAKAELDRLVRVGWTALGMAPEAKR